VAVAAVLKTVFRTSDARFKVDLGLHRWQRLQKIILFDFE